MPPPRPPGSELNDCSHDYTKLITIISLLLIMEKGDNQIASHKNSILQRDYSHVIWVSTLWICKQWNPVGRKNTGQGVHNEAVSFFTRGTGFMGANSNAVIFDYHETSIRLTLGDPTPTSKTLVGMLLLV